MLYVLRDPVWFWQAFGTYEGQPIRFDDWQVVHLHDYAQFRAREKAPQIGFSWLSSLEAEWDNLLHLDSTSGFVSVDQREASEKVLYAKKAYAELAPWIQDAVPLVKESTEELWFGDKDRPSRLMSIPATSALRGRKMSVYLDEADFYKDGGKDAKRVALGRVTRGGRVTMGSTCFGVDTELDRTMQKEGSNFSTMQFPYTVAENPDVQKAIEIARQELDSDDFDEEYACVRGGSTSDTFPVALIKAALHDDAPIPLDELDTRAPTIAAYDVGGSRHPSVISVIENTADEWRQIVLEEIRNKTLPDQEGMLIDLLTKFPNMSLVIDEVGIGLQAAQALTSRFGSRVIAMHAGSKPDGMPVMGRADMVVETRKALEGDRLKLLADREQQQQFHRTRLVKGTGGNLIVDQPGSKKRTHYDKFWTVNYAWYGVRARARESVYEKRGIVVVGGHSETTRTGRLKRPRLSELV